jgi:nucleoside-diphosphate-sugar epimerase
VTFDGSPRALVTGATGFVGSWLSSELVERGWAVTALVRAASESRGRHPGLGDGVRWQTFESHDQVSSLVTQVQPDYVFHLAADQGRGTGLTGVAQAIDANVMLGLRLLEAVEATPAIVINAMSYFQFLDGLPVTRSLYTATKQAFFDLAEYYRVCQDVDVRHVVLFDNYGPHDTRPKLINDLLRNATANLPTTIGPREQRLNLLHVADVARGLISATENANPHLMTVRADHVITTGEVIDTLERVRGSRFTIDIDHERPTVALADRAGDWPTPHGWSPQVPLEEGLAQLVS